jgi:hypothetical protein
LWGRRLVTRDFLLLLWNSRSVSFSLNFMFFLSRFLCNSYTNFLSIFLVLLFSFSVCLSQSLSAYISVCLFVQENVVTFFLLYSVSYSDSCGFCELHISLLILDVTCFSTYSNFIERKSVLLNRLLLRNCIGQGYQRNFSNLSKE